MAIIPSDTYPGQTLSSDPDYPHGKARNVTVSGDGTGTPLEATWLNDLWGFLQALLAEGAVTPSGDPDKVGASDYLTALYNAFVKIAANDTITPTTLTADVDDYEPTGWDAARMVRLNADAARSINGLKKSTTPKLVVNISNFDLTLLHLDAEQAAGNQIRTPNGADYVLPRRAVALFVHDATSDAWRLVGENLAAKAWTWTAVHDFDARVDMNAAGTALDVTAGNIVVTAGDITAVAGDVVATGGNIVATAGDVTAGGKVVSAGDVIAGQQFEYEEPVGRQKVIPLVAQALGSWEPAFGLYRTSVNGASIRFPFQIPPGCTLVGVSVGATQGGTAGTEMYAQLLRITRSLSGSASESAIATSNDLDDSGGGSNINDVLEMNDVDEPALAGESYAVEVTASSNASVADDYVNWIEITYLDLGPRN